VGVTTVTTIRGVDAKGERKRYCGFVFDSLRQLL
jgi:hypothetical protein